MWDTGVLESDPKPGPWDKYEGLDGENEIVLFRDQDVIHSIVTSVRYVDNILWAATYLRQRNCVPGIDLNGNDLWVAAAKGSSHGIYEP